MKPTHLALFLGAAVGATVTLSAQSTATSSSGTRSSTVHSTAHRSAATRPTAAACADLPTLSALIPRVAGCPKPLYALRYTDTVVGTGQAVSPRKWLTVNYTGYLVDGTKFDSSFGTGPDGKPKEPITFPYGARQVIAGWDTGFEGMNIGGKRRLYIPYQLAYGEPGRAPIPPRAQLIFDVELLGISETPPQPKAPPAPPPGTVPPTGGTPSNPPGNAIPPTTAPQESKPAPPTDPTKPTAIPPTTAPPATTPKPSL